MLLLKPATITPGMVTASNAGAADADYNPATSYALNARVFLPDNGKTYVCIQAPALDKYPATSALYWLLAEPSNRWAMWDAEISTASQTSGSLTATLVVPTRFNALSFHGLQGQALTVVQKTPLGEVIKTHTQTLVSSATSWYSYFFGYRTQVRDAVVTGMYPVAGSTLEITVSAPSGSPAACAAVTVGSTLDIGAAEYGFTTSILDYSRKETSATGVQTLKPGRRSKRMQGSLSLERGRYNAISAALESVAGLPCAWIGVPDSADYEPMTILGFYRDFQIEVSGPTHHTCSLEIEGLT